MALIVTPVLAFRGHEFEKSFGKAGSGNGEFSEPSGVAASDATGEVYVLDQGNARVERFSSTGVYESQFNGSETPATAFDFGDEALTDGIAVDNSCHLHKPALTEVTKPTCKEFDPSGGDVYLTDPDNGVVDKFNPEGKYLGQLQEACGKTSCPAFIFEDTIHRREPKALAGVGVDAGGIVWVYGDNQHVSGDVDSFTNGEPNVFSSAQRLEGTTGPFNSPGFAVDSHDDFYARKSNNLIYKFGTKGEPVIEPFVVEETSAVAVDLSSGEVFLDNIGSVGAFNGSAVLQERFGSGHLMSGSGLAVNHESSTNSTVYVTDSTADVVDVFPPEPPGPPIVVDESVSNVTGDSATLKAELNPRGAGTEYRFEYGRCVTPATCASSAYEESIPVPDGFAGADFEVHGVSMNPQDLLAGTVYHFRVVTHNEVKGKVETVDGAEQTFTTQATGVFALPDAREWELVSPLEKHGALVEAIAEAGLAQASGSGGAMTYLTASPTETGPQGVLRQGQVLSTRGPDGWVSRDIEIPFNTATGFPLNGAEYEFFSEDLSVGVLQPLGSFNPSLSAEASEQTAYLRTNFLHGDSSEPCLPSTMHCYRPLVTGAEGFANVPEGTVFGEEPEGTCIAVQCGPKFLGATPDLSHVVLTSPSVALKGGASAGSLYEWSGGEPASEQLQLISVLPEGGGPASGGLALGYSSGDVRHAVSDDGSRIVWSESRGGGHLYMRDMVRRETVPLDGVQPGGSGSGGVSPVFQDASSDGARVFFTDSQQLTADSEAGEGKADLYECEIVESVGKLGCALSDLTMPLSSGEHAEVRGAVLGSNEDGSYVYLVANSVLVSNKNASGEMAAPGADNLYVLHHSGSGWAVTFIAALSGGDSPDWAKDSPANLEDLTARVSPDGRWLAFMSARSLTGYDNRDALSGKPDEEVYLYEAGHERLVCASCNPTGARPVGEEYVHLGAGEGSKVSIVGGSAVWEGSTWLAANIPGWTPYATGRALHQSRYLSNSGRLFFNSSDALASQDVNGGWDVYQYEPPGVGGCTTTAASFSERSGCVGLISSGTSPEESAFLDASETGDDVFFLTSARLVPRERETGLSLYDAHECTTSSPCFPEAAQATPPCDTEASCKAPPAPQPSIFGVPSSATFSGMGNLTPARAASLVKPKGLTRAQKLAKALRACKKKVRHVKRCERSARAKYGPVRRKSARKKGSGRS